MKKLLVFLLIFSVLAAGSTAQTTQQPPKRDRARTEATPAASPTPKKLNFFQRLFGRRPRKPSPTPTPSPTPRKQRRPKPKASPAAVETAAPEKTATPSPKQEAAPAPTVKPAPPRKEQEGMTNQVPFVPESREPEPASKRGNIGIEDDSQERARYEKVRQKALEDQRVQELKEKADNAETDEAAAKASRDYYKALYGTMRKLDGSLKDRIDRTEAATMRRVEKSIGGGND